MAARWREKFSTKSFARQHRGRGVGGGGGSSWGRFVFVHRRAGIYECELNSCIVRPVYVVCFRPIVACFVRMADRRRRERYLGVVCRTGKGVNRIAAKRCTFLMHSHTHIRIHNYNPILFETKPNAAPTSWFIVRKLKPDGPYWY